MEKKKGTRPQKRISRKLFKAHFNMYVFANEILALSPSLAPTLLSVECATLALSFERTIVFFLRRGCRFPFLPPVFTHIHI